MFLARRFRAARALSVAAAGTMVASIALVVAAPAHAAEIYPRPWDNTVTVSGHGWGHGHGMSQWGAYGAATLGKTWQQIVDFYYPNTVRTQIGNPAIRVSVAGGLGYSVVVSSAVGLRVTYGTGLTGAVNLITADTTAPILYWYVVTSGGMASLHYQRSDGQSRMYPVTTSGQVNVDNPTTGKVVAHAPSGTLITYTGRLSGMASGTSSVSPVLSLPMETYLRGVVPSESPSSWPQAALAAQAVAARSYAKYAIDHPRAPGYYDICDTTSCQVFNGLATEPPSSNTAIQASAGWAMYYGDAAAFTEFGSSNGGWSADGGKPYLVAQADPYDGVIPNSANSWTNTIPVASIEATWPSIGSYRQLRIISRDGNGQWGGRVLQAALDGSAGSVTVTGATIRSAFGLRSEWFVPTNVRSAPSYPRDFSGDRLADVLAVVAGTGDLRMYAGNGASGWKSMSVIRNGFTGFSKIFTAGTWDNDALSDVMAQTPDGNLWLYPGTASGPLGPQRQVGAGWGIYNLVFPVGDFGGDGLSDLLARRPDGGMMLYSGNGAGGFFNNTRQIGAGWGIFTSVFSPGDFNGDHKPDVIARTSGGLLYLYPGNGSGGWLRPRLIGQGWNMYSTIISCGDFSGDGKSDVLARDRDGTLWMYAGDGTGGFLQRKVVGTGWNMFSTILS